MIIRSGINVYPEEIELAVQECSEITDCVVFGESTENGTAICLKYTGNIGPREIRSRLVKMLNPNTVPGRIERVDEISRTASGKKIRR